MNENVCLEWRKTSEKLVILPKKRYSFFFLKYQGLCGSSPSFLASRFSFFSHVRNLIHAEPQDAFTRDKKAKSGENAKLSLRPRHANKDNI